MKRIFVELSALLLFLAFIFVILEFLFRDYKTSVDHIMDDFLKDHRQAEVLLIGNSHSIPLYQSLKADPHSNVACLTIGGDDLFWMQALVKKYIGEMPRLKYVILNCDDELLGFNQTLSGLQYLNRILYQYADTMYGNKTTDILLSRSHFFRSNRDIGYLFNRQANEDVMVANLAGGSSGFSDEECKARAIEISERRFHRKFFPENISYLESIIAEVSRHQAKLFILRMPKCECLLESVVQTNLLESRQMLDALFKSRMVEVLDFTEDRSFTRSEFSNPDHLTVQASRKLLKMVNQRIFLISAERPVRLSDP